MDMTTHCGCGCTFTQKQTLDVCPECGTRHYRFGASFDFEDEEE